MAGALRKFVKFSAQAGKPIYLGWIKTYHSGSSLNTRNIRILSPVVCKTAGTMVPTRQLSSSALDQKFAESQKLVTTLNEEPDNDVKLKLYALFKQGTVGKCNIAKPSALDFVGKAKWQAWSVLGELSNDDAKSQYIDTVKSLLNAQNVNSSTAEAGASTQNHYPGMIVTKDKGILTIQLNRPEKKNAITAEMYLSVTQILNEANQDNTVAAIVLRGTGDYFSSGNDLSNFIKLGGGDVNLEEVAAKSAVLLKNYVDAFVNFSKPLIGVINGPAVGIAVTVLGLCDFVYATDKATFHTPFSALGQSPEGCSSYTFPKIMGSAKANEILMLNKKITAAEAKTLGLLTEVFPADSFEKEVSKILDSIAALPKLSLAYAKQLTRNTEIELLRKVNVEECERLKERWLSDDCKKAIMAFFQGKAKY